MEKGLLKAAGIVSIVLGILSCLSLFGAIIGIPMIIGGIKIKDYSELSDEEILAMKDTILTWTVVFLFINQIGGILLLIFYLTNISNYGKNVSYNTNNSDINNNTVNNDKRYDELERVKKLYDDKVINKEEFEKEKNRILNN